MRKLAGLALALLTVGIATSPNLVFVAAYYVALYVFVGAAKLAP